MRKREQGILNVEASIVLTFMTLFVLFLFSFIRVYRAENMVSHATLQAADAMALESYLRENALDDKADDVVYLANRLTGASTLNVENFESLRSANIPTIAKEKFVAAVSNSESNANTILTNYGVKDGLSGIDFSTSTVDLDRDDVIVNVSYTLKMQFPIFGATEINVTKSAKAKTFGEILFEITAEPENPNMGYTTGTGNYQHGATVRITAHPNTGYRFVSWNDGVASNPRDVSVTEAKKFIAIYEEAGYGVNAECDPHYSSEKTNGAYGLVTVIGNKVAIPGGGEGYEKGSTVTVKAIPTLGYHVENWIITKDKTGSSISINSEQTEYQIIVDQSYTVKSIFKPNKYKVTVQAEITGSNANIFAKSSHGSGNQIDISYGEQLLLYAPNVPGYDFNGWRVQGSTNIIYDQWGNFIFKFETTNNITYVAKYTAIPKYTVTLNPNGGSCDRTSLVVQRGKSTDGLPTPKRAGYSFSGWKNDSTIYKAGEQVKNVVQNITLIAQWSKCKHSSSSELGKHQFLCRAVNGSHTPVCSICGSDCRKGKGIKNSYVQKKCNTCGEVFYEENAKLNVHIIPKGCEKSKLKNSVEQGEEYFGKIKLPTKNDDFNSICSTKHDTTYEGTCGQKGYKKHKWDYYYHIICDHCHAVEEPPRSGKQYHWCGKEDDDHTVWNKSKAKNVDCSSFSKK